MVLPRSGAGQVSKAPVQNQRGEYLSTAASQAIVWSRTHSALRSAIAAGIERSSYRRRRHPGQRRTRVFSGRCGLLVTPTPPLHPGRGRWLPSRRRGFRRFRFGAVVSLLWPLLVHGRVRDRRRRRCRPKRNAVRGLLHKGVAPQHERVHEWRVIAPCNVPRSIEYLSPLESERTNWPPAHRMTSRGSLTTVLSSKNRYRSI